MVEDDSALVGGDEERVVDMEFEVVLAGETLCVGEGHSGEVGDGAPCAVAGSDLHEQVCGDGHHEDDRGDEEDVPEEPVLADPGDEAGLFLHG